MSIRIRFGALSLGASVDQQTGHLSVFDVLEEVRTHQLPVVLPNLVISLLIDKESASGFEGKVYLHHLLPDGVQNKVGVGDLSVPNEQTKMKAVFRFSGFPISLTGRHQLVVSVVNDKADKVGEHVFDFDVVQSPQVAQAPGGKRPPGLAH